MDFFNNFSIDMSWVLTILISVVITSLILTVIYFIYKSTISRASTEDNYMNQLDEIISGSEPVKTEQNIIENWNTYWGKILGGASFVDYDEDDNKAGRDVFFGIIIIALLIFVLSRNIFIALIVPPILAYGLIMVARTSSNNKSRELIEQLPGMLFALKSNLQAGNTNERALMEIVDSMPSPLYDDLVVARNILAANGTFQEALIEMSNKTTSRDLKFLCSCMIQASQSGASMTQQIDNIQKVLESRKEVSDKIDTAVKAVSPALWLSGLVIPAMFVVSYFLDSAAKGFWFQNLISWIGFLVVVALYIAGLLLTKQQVDKVRNI